MVALPANEYSIIRRAWIDSGNKTFHLPRILAFQIKRDCSLNDLYEWCYCMSLLSPFLMCYFVLSSFVPTFSPFSLDTNDQNSTTAPNSLKDTLDELRRQISVFRSENGRQPFARELPNKFGTAGNVSKYYKLLKMPASFWDLLRIDNGRPTEEQRLNISNVSEGSGTDPSCGQWAHIQHLFNAPEKISKENAKVFLLLLIS
jgi:hypothetical protein